MVLEFRLPHVNPHMSKALIECMYAEPGTTLKAGAKLLDLSVDLGDTFLQDCPPISFYRIVMRENVVLRELRVGVGQPCAPGELIAVFSGSASDVVDEPAQRSIRFVTAGIVRHGGMWTENIR